MKKWLLFNPAGAHVYNRARVKPAVPRLPSLALAMIGGSLLEEGCEVQIVDLTLAEIKDPETLVKKEIAGRKPDVVGVTATTPLFYEAARISKIAKEVSKDIVTVLGGPHASALPVESIAESSFDYVVAGEGEAAIKEITGGEARRGIKGVYCRSCPDEQVPAAGIQRTPELPIDELPFPALQLFVAEKYGCSKSLARRNPVAPVEFSRGCLYDCNYCSKKVFGRRFRIKSPKRVVEELLIVKKLGYREFHVLDDQFTTEIEKAKEICREIIRSRIDLTWNLRGGVRVDKIDKEFLDLARRAGCHQLGVGFESGSQACLDEIGKGTRLEQAVRAAELISKAGIRQVGFFMLGFMGESSQTMEETIRFAVRLNPDYAKVTIMVPLPGTKVYDTLKRRGLLRTEDWSRYTFHNAYGLFQHPTLSPDTLKRYYEMFYRRFYFRPNYLVGSCWRSCVRGELFDYLASGYQAFFRKG